MNGRDVRESLRHVPGDHCGTIAEIEITCAFCDGKGITVRDIVPSGWIEALAMGGHAIHREPFFGKRPESTWLCSTECAEAWFSSLDTVEEPVRSARREEGRGEVSASELSYDDWEAAR